MNRNNGFLVGGVDGLKGLALNTLHPLAINVQAERLLVGDAGGLDLLCQSHGCGSVVMQSTFGKGYHRKKRVV